MGYELRHADTRVKWLVTCLLATFGVAYLFGGWMVALYAGFTPAGVAQTYAGPGMAMPMPPDSTVVVEHPMTMAGFAQADVHEVDLNLLIQDTHVHVPMYGVIAAVLSLVVLGLALPKGWHLGLIALLFAAPWLDFAGMWLTKLVSRDFAFVTVLGGWAMGLGYLIVAAVAVRQMWFYRKGAVS
ncbi:MAG TPA: hypothetical protein VGQ06_15565 [Gemmatimonadales bacterium]|jgi:hypothetical protein|nr:hypothetical protein [Gemmatimonadales bacterium]